MNHFLETTIRVFGTPKWALLKAQRLAYYKRRFPNGKISQHFTYREFFCRDGMPPPSRAADHLAWYAVNVLEPLRAKFGVARITGPYRHYWYNKNVVGGATLSYHVWDRYVDGTVNGSELACDLVFASGTPTTWAAEAGKILAKLGRGGGVGIYTASHFTHVDSRHTAARWKG